MHGIILGGILEREDTSETRNQLDAQDDSDKPDFWPSIKRSAGAHRIATFLREEGWDIEVLDFWPAWTREELEQFFESRVREDTVWVGLSAMFPLGGSGKKNQQRVTELVENLKYMKEKYPNLTWVGGSQNINATLAYPLDYFIGGFGEYGILELLKKLTGKPNNCIVHKKFYWGAERNVIECQTDFPAYPFPNAHVKYEERDYIQPDEILTIELARGCKFQCKFCSFTVLGVKGDYSRCEQSLEDELNDNYKSWGTTMYTISDETVNDRPEKLAKIARVVRKLPFTPQLSGFARADLLVAHPETWEDMWDMGFWSHFYGIETFNHEAGKYVGKGMNPDRLKEGLIKVREWFQAKGKYRATISMIIGIPHETKETFLDAKDWVMKNMPGQSYNFAPLMISNNDSLRMMTNPSVFDKTWQEGNVFREKTHEELGVDYNQIPERLREVVEFYMKADGVLDWEHDDMTVWDAWKIFAEIVSTPELPSKLGPGIFYYHRYITGGKYNLDDMRKTFADIKPLGVENIKLHMSLIEDYKRKKLEAV
jgi:hypothetical protein